jgi:thiosulfate/3-mercaptopyruvate sulfurtransferase
MKKLHSCLVGLLLTTLLTTLLIGCGSNSGGETQPAPLQTGDTPFPNNALLASPANVDTSQAIVIDARTLTEYTAGHIPGAISAPIIMFEDSKGVLLGDGELQVQLGKLGITPTSKIIIYDKATDTNSAAGRLFWILKYMGCNDVSILNGGWDKWIAYDHDWTTAVTALPETVFTGQPSDTTKIAVKADIVKHFLHSTESGYVLIDVRTKEEYERGHIPGAYNFPYSNCFNPDRTVLKVEELKPLLAPYTDKEMIVYSNKNHRGGFFYFLCQLMNYPNVTIYLGSIEDWIEANPDAYTLVSGNSRY